jgi:hypothetical protein
VNSSATRKDKSSNFWIPELHNKQYLWQMHTTSQQRKSSYVLKVVE